MFIAHVPSGYLLGVLLQRLQRRSALSRPVLPACMLGATVPDLDLFYCYLVDGRQTHHHQYFSHWPSLWLGLTILAGLWLSLRRDSTGAAMTLAFALGGMLHLLPDSFVGDIWWLAPSPGQPFALFGVPALHQPWWLNFLLHWTFVAELAICAAALLAYRIRRGHRQTEHRP